MVSRAFLRFAIVGLASNAVLFALYVVLTSAGMPHVPAMTLVYVLGVLQTFAANRHWTFGHTGAVGAPLLRYALAYVLGYLLNLTLMLMLVDAMHLPHAWVQGALILVVAVFLFLLQKHWVFRPSPSAAARRG